MNEVALIFNDIIAAFARGHIEPVNVTVSDEIIDRINDWLFDYMGMTPDEGQVMIEDYGTILDFVSFEEEVLF